MSPPAASPSSPRAIEGQAPHRTLSSSASRSPVNAIGSHRPSTVGSSYRDNADVQRQMQQDIDSAMSMSRARSGSLVDRSPVLRGTMGRYSSSPIEETPFGMLSDSEEREIARARHEQEEVDSAEYDANVKALHASESTDSFEQHRQRRGSDPGGRRKPTYRVGADGIVTHFDFNEMEDFAAHERAKLQDDGMMPRKKPIPVPPAAPVGQAPLSQSDTSDKAMLDRTSSETQALEGEEELPKEDDAPQTNFHRRRARKQAQNNPGRRQAKLALFENFGNGGGDDAVGALKAPRHRHGQQQPQPSVEAPGSGFEEYTDVVPATKGHDRPYRFSFYSNALPVTIHARNISELPAEGQSFEDLFKGRNNSLGPGARDSGEFAYSGRNTPNDPSQLSLSNPRALANQALQNAAAKSTPPGIPPGVTAEEDPEAYTWWLDVLSPTDEEMRMLSKTFGIHPLTTEDILLEETREKIELFRTYYLVCFRSFDQDPYSQTYLEPLNMYIIVFREGTLSFHFRGTPHPQNVRRRIKHLKDYISVTSDWISYALIDDITDAFGPLIQSIEYEADSIDELVLILKEAEQTDMLRRIGTCRKKVMGLLRLMGSKADVVKGLAKRCNENWLVAPKSDIGLYLSDIQDHLITMTSNLNHYEKILSRSHSNYLAQISIEMTDANNQINDVLSKLTALGTVLIPMNLVTGLWGMNVHVPGEDIKEGYAWFGGILGCLALFAILGAWATYKCFVR